jgi:Transposase DDE domain
VLLLDGKALKNVGKRLSSTRGQAGRMLGGKLLVAYRPQDGQVLDLAVNLDGEGNEAALVPELAERLRQRPGQTTLFVADRQFSSLKAFRQFSGKTSHFAVRHAKTLSFTADPDRPAVRHRDPVGRVVIEEWGWVGKGDRCEVRRVSVQRANDEPVAVLSDLLDGVTVPAVDLLEVDRQRWEIESCFRDVTELFALDRFVGSTAEATVFQACLAFVLSNLQAVLNGFIAVNRGCAVDDLSMRQIRQDWHRQLVALKELTTVKDLAAAIRPVATAEEMRTELTQCLSGVWQKGWTKTRNKNPRPKTMKAKGSGAHTSVIRCQNAAKPRPDS